MTNLDIKIAEGADMAWKLSNSLLKKKKTFNFKLARISCNLSKSVREYIKKVLMCLTCVHDVWEYVST